MTTSTLNPQLDDDIDPMELQDQETPEEAAEQGNLEDDLDEAELDSAEESALVKDIDAVISVDGAAEEGEEEQGELEEKPAVPAKKPQKTIAADTAPKKKPAGHLVSQELIERALTPDDLIDDGYL